MIDTSKLKTTLLSISKTIFWMISVLVFSFLFISLVGWYWSYYDLGIGFQANTFVLFVLYLPSIIIFLSITTILSNHFLKKLINSRIFGSMVSILILFIFVIILFFIEVWRTASTIPNLDLISFLWKYFSGKLW